jgi:hypothetical protein
MERAYIGIAPAAQSYLCIYIIYIYTVQIKLVPRRMPVLIGYAHNEIWT